MGEGSVKVTIEDDAFSITMEGSSTFCSTICENALYFKGVADWKKIPKRIIINQEIKQTPQELKNKLDSSILNTKKRKYNIWTTAEENIIRDHFHKDGIDKTKELLPRRTKKQILQKARKMGCIL